MICRTCRFQSLRYILFFNSRRYLSFLGFGGKGGGGGGGGVAGVAVDRFLG